MALKHRLSSLRLSRTRDRPPKEKPTLIAKVDITLKVFTFIIVLLSGGWAYYKFLLNGGDGWAINIKLETHVLPYRDNLRLLVVNVKSINSRPSEIELDGGKCDRYELSFRALPPDLSENEVIREDSGTLIKTEDLLPKSVPYDFMPGLEMTDMRAIVVKPNSNVLVFAEIDKMNNGCAGSKDDFDFVSASTVVNVSSLAAHSSK